MLVSLRIEIKLERNRFTIRQAFAPTARNHQRGLHALPQQIAIHPAAGRLQAPVKSFVRRNHVDETLRARRVVGIDQNRRHIRHLARFESMAENESENRRQNDEQNRARADREQMWRNSLCATLAMAAKAKRFMARAVSAPRCNLASRR